MEDICMNLGRCLLEMVLLCVYGLSLRFWIVGIVEYEFSGAEKARVVGSGPTTLACRWLETTADF